MLTKKQATDRAAALMRRVRGTGWKTFVFENLGWHFHLQLGELKLYQDEHSGRYWTLMGDRADSPGGAQQFTTGHKSFKDPNRAVAFQLDVARAWTARLNNILDVIGLLWDGGSNKGLASKKKKKVARRHPKSKGDTDRIEQMKGKS